MKYLKHTFHIDNTGEKYDSKSSSSFSEFKKYSSDNKYASASKLDLIKHLEQQTTQQEWITKQINSRMNELRKMFRYKEEALKFKLESQPKDIKETILSLANIPSHSYRESIQMNFKTKKDKLKNFLKIVYVMIKSLMRKRKYFLDKWQEGFDDDFIDYNSEIRKIQIESLTNPSYFKSALTTDAVICLRKLSSFRTPSDLRKIKWNLERLKAFDRIIPVDMQDELAKRVVYEKYENNRIIAEEHKLCKRIYFIISGKIKLFKKFDLSSGNLFKNVGFINRGDTTDPEEVERSWIREHTLVSHGVTEVLYVDYYDLLVLRRDYQHFPVEFLKSLSIFNNFPFENLIFDDETIMLQYYGQKQTIKLDAEKSPWLYIVKSGKVKVIKRVKALTNNEIRLTSPLKKILRLSPVTEIKSPIMTRQFPFIKRAKSVVHRPASKIIDLKLTQSKIQPEDSKKTPRFKTAPATKRLINSSLEDNEIKSIEEKSRVRFRTSSSLSNQEAKVEEQMIYVSIDLLERGSVFGLNFLNSEKSFYVDHNNMLKDFEVFKSNNENEKLILYSEGCELILLSKNAFIRYADSSTICLIEQIAQQFSTEEKIRGQLIDASKWACFKKKLIQDLATKKKFK